jgi:hypothetical protein
MYQQRTPSKICRDRDMEWRKGTGYALAGRFLFGLSTGLSSPLPSASLLPLSLFLLKRAIVRDYEAGSYS